jgi:hypothetical protein
MEVAPKFQAGSYRDSGKLQDCAALITGGDSGIGRGITVLFADVAGLALARAEWKTISKMMLECL